MAVRPAPLTGAAESISGSDIDGPRLLRRLEELAQRGALPGGGISRLAYGTAWIAAQQLVSDWMRESGLLIRRDAAGNLFGRVEGSRGGRVILVGSHLDTVRGGGALDGALGIIAGLEALDALVRTRGRPQRIVEVVAIADHEGGRFGVPAFGARAIAGRLEPDEAARVRDDDGVSLADALRAASLDPSALAATERLDVEAFIELHVEQGTLLDRAPARLGVAKVTTGTVLIEVDVRGVSDHAGAPMDGRRDALLAAGEMVLAVAALGAGAAPAVATVGDLAVSPRQTSVVPARVRFTVDVRGADGPGLADLVKDIRRVCARIAHERDLSCDLRVLRDLAPRTLDASLAHALTAACERAGVSPREMTSPAAHDAAVLAATAHTGLLLVPSIDGRSHCAEEATEAEDVLLGARALTFALESLLYG